MTKEKIITVGDTTIIINTDNLPEIYLSNNWDEQIAEAIIKHYKKND